MKKLISIFFIIFLLFLHINIIKNCGQSISIIRYINRCMDGQVSVQNGTTRFEERAYDLTNRIKNIYAYRPPKAVFEGSIVWSVLGFMVYKSYKIDKEIFA